MILQAIIAKTAIEAVKRAFWKNGDKTASIVSDVLKVKAVSDDPHVHNEAARAIAWLLRGLVIIALVKVAQVLGFDITPYLHTILESATETAVETTNAAG